MALACRPGCGLSLRRQQEPLARTGSVNAEGDEIHRTSDVRASYSQSGSGVKVGIISDGVDHQTDARSSGDLPADLTVLNNTQGGCGRGIRGFRTKSPG
ncbi:MAG: hypothetical protein U9Q37_07800 [Euryarchaeota archaeon]|nr:hypothetical protein [Euryarchaeota archaeon]